MDMSQHKENAFIEYVFTSTKRMKMMRYSVRSIYVNGIGLPRATGNLLAGKLGRSCRGDNQR
jgi:hypothetical protein